ncbi:MAG: NUDIX domain-containing protein, partial [Armatimonadetes bacterium]|nr:NUDIX domain-containing protein [Armatimonadota bacterium]
ELSAKLVAMTEYWRELRRLVGPRPLLLCGANAFLVDNQGRVLLHHRTDNDTWSIPGGMAKLGERMEETARRETREEVGLSCHGLTLFGVYSGPELYYSYPNGDGVHNITISYLCRDFSGEIEVDLAEGKAAAFFPIDELPPHICPPVRPIIADFVHRYGAIAAGGGTVARPFSPAALHPEEGECIQSGGSARSGYVRELRKLVGTRPLLLASANGILLDAEDRILLLRRTDNDMWGLPGGAAEPGGRVEETAVREVYEEAGLMCRTLALFGVYSGPELHYRYPNGDEVHNVAISYLCRDFSGTIRADGVEAKEGAFFALEELPAEISPVDRFIIEGLIRRRDEVVSGIDLGPRP